MVGEVSNCPLRFFENTFTHCQTMLPLAAYQALYFQPLHLWSGGRAVEGEDSRLGSSCGRQNIYLFSRLNPKNKQGLPKYLKTCLVISAISKARKTTTPQNNSDTLFVSNTLQLKQLYAEIKKWQQDRPFKILHNLNVVGILRELGTAEECL